MDSRIKDISGKKFGSLTAVEVVDRPVDKITKGVYWKCLCDCGNAFVCFGATLKKGAIKSCGCSREKSVRKLNEVAYKKSRGYLDRATEVNQACRRHGVSSRVVYNLITYKGATLEKAILIAKAQKQERLTR